jgi:spore maturation protein CgeB
MATAFDELLHRRLADAARQHECEAVLTVQGDLSPAAVTMLQRNRIPVALWYPDHVGNLGRQRMLLAPYTAWFFKDPLLVNRLRDMLGIPVWHLPQSCNPRWHRPLGDAGTRRGIAVVGNGYPSRLGLLRRLHEAGIPLILHGAPVPVWARGTLPPELRTGPPVFREDKSRVFRSAAAVLNNLHLGEMHGVNLRLFEATAAGAAVLCEQRQVLSDLFDPGTEVVPFTNFGQLVERARELLDDQNLTCKLGDAASQRAHAEHTYVHRLPQILDKLA